MAIEEMAVNVETIWGGAPLLSLTAFTFPSSEDSSTHCWVNREENPAHKLCFKPGTFIASDERSNQLTTVPLSTHLKFKHCKPTLWCSCITGSYDKIPSRRFWQISLLPSWPQTWFSSSVSREQRMLPAASPWQRCCITSFSSHSHGCLWRHSCNTKGEGRTNVKLVETLIAKPPGSLASVPSTGPMSHALELGCHVACLHGHMSNS